MSSSVKIRGSRYGITVRIQADASYEEVKKDIAVCFREADSLFKDEKLGISFEGMYLTEEQQEELVDIIHENCSLHIICIMDDNSGKEQRFKQNLEEYQMEFDASTGQFYKGNLRSGQVLEFEKSVIVIGDVNPGATIISKGNIIILGALKGTAFAGASGRKNCFIVAMTMNPLQLRIADVIARAGDSSEGKTAVEPKIAVCDDENIYIEPLTKSVLNDIKF